MARILLRGQLDVENELPANLDEYEIDYASIARGLTVPDAEEIADVGAGELRCDCCGKTLDDEVVSDGDRRFYHRECLDIGDMVEKAEAFAIEKCKITGELPRYDPSQEFRCSPKDYELGDRESYTENSTLARCRHSHTNYDELIAGLDRDALADRIRYRAIRNRIDTLVLEKLAEMEDEETENLLHDTGDDRDE